MTTEEYVKLHVGTFVLSIAALQAEVDKLKADLAAKTSEPKPLKYE
jgi:uncharacterized small protein (DUF1192 family)